MQRLAFFTARKFEGNIRKFSGKIGAQWLQVGTGVALVDASASRVHPRDGRRNAN
ncbi:hypothetical protein KZJ38_08870 [Paraburkholderia edwinii]|uniref:Uncharacterized protein n=1 Tax=Paraburkholderia edwinii TaxID=2861782 RepID=A0ABX8UP43_9BURK|nr:hypothetical protein [Paraburkholderia edwinii]QYD70381.1 hypothetical protein KZJ38_08870 [Paraburkholderia edwinii]